MKKTRVMFVASTVILAIAGVFAAKANTKGKLATDAYSKTTAGTCIHKHGTCVNTGGQTCVLDAKTMYTSAGCTLLTTAI